MEDPLEAAKLRGAKRKKEMIDLIAKELRVDPLEFAAIVIPMIANHGQDFWMLANFFLYPNDRLFGQTPLEVLRLGGQFEAVLSAALTYGEQGAS